jgi:phosphatidylglycerophosphate synthase
MCKDLMTENNHIPKRDNFFESQYSKIADVITPFFMSYTANQITIVSGIFGVVGSLLLISSNYLALFFSALFIQLFSVLDLVDGNIARIKKIESKFGMWLDIFFDKLVDFMIIITAPLGIYINTGNSNILICGIILMGSVFLSQLIMILNFSEKFFSTSRLGGSSYLNFQKKKISFIFKIVFFFRNHLSYQHNTFLFLISFFAIINQIEFGIYFLTIHSLFSLLLSITINFLRIR